MKALSKLENAACKVADSNVFLVNSNIGFGSNPRLFKLEIGAMGNSLCVDYFFTLNNYM